MLEKLNGEGYDTTVYTFGPGTVFGDHSHSVCKKDAILGGRFLFRMAGEEVWQSLSSKQPQPLISSQCPLTSGACLSLCKAHIMTLRHSAFICRCVPVHAQDDTGQPY